MLKIKANKILPEGFVLVIVAYDIKDDKKRSKIAKVLESFGDRVQYSVFECILNKTKLGILKKSLMVFTLDEGESIVIYTVKSGKYLEKWRRVTKEPFKRAQIL